MHQLCILFHSHYSWPGLPSLLNQEHRPALFEKVALVKCQMFVTLGGKQVIAVRH